MMLALTRDDDVRRFTRIPGGGVDGAYVTSWIGRYEAGWEDGSRIAFAIVDLATGAVLGFAGAVDLELDARQAEIGYMTAPAAAPRRAHSRCSAAGAWTSSASSGSSSASTRPTRARSASPSARATVSRERSATCTSRTACGAT